MSEKFNQEFAKYDTDGSGTIGENLLACKLIYCRRQIPHTGIKTTTIDFDSWCFLDLNEAKAFVAAIGAGIPDSKVEEYFKKYDTDGNGSLDKDECLQLVKNIFPEFQ